MTDTEINIAIAEACGWSRIHTTDFRPWGNHPSTDRSTMSDEYLIKRPIPNYVNDLNAMHDAESRFLGDASAAMSYAMHLLQSCGLMVVSEYDELNVDYCWAGCYATARQRAEAFLRTIGKWEEATND